MKLRNVIIAAIVVLVSQACSGDKTGDNQQQESAEKPFTLNMLVGTYTGDGSEGIYNVEYNPETGTLSGIKLVATASNPSYLTTSKDKKVVMSVNEDNPGMLSAYNWNQDSDTLTLINQLPTEGSAPCYVDMGPGDETVAVANYGSGNIAVFQVSSDGTIAPSPQTRQHAGSGPVESRQQGPHAHCSIFKENFLYAADLGTDQILSYSIAADGSLGEGKVAYQLEPGDGPRHLVFHPSKAHAYVVNELSNTVVALQADLKSGKLEKIERYSTLPADFEGQSFVADVHVSASGRYLYVSNRGHNSIAIFAIEDNGSLSPVGHESVRGDWPRNFTFSPDGNFLLVANQRSNNIVVFEVDKESGKMTFSGHQIEISQPVCLTF